MLLELHKVLYLIETEIPEIYIQGKEERNLYIFLFLLRKERSPILY